MHRYIEKTQYDICNCYACIITTQCICQLHKGVVKKHIKTKKYLLCKLKWWGLARWSLISSSVGSILEQYTRSANGNTITTQHLSFALIQIHKRKKDGWWSMNSGVGASAGHNTNSRCLLIRTMVNTCANASNGSIHVCWSELMKKIPETTNCNFGNNTVATWEGFILQLADLWVSFL